MFYNFESKFNKSTGFLSLFLLFPILLLLSASEFVNAAPTEGIVSAGNATITTPKADTTQVVQTSEKAVIDWHSFNLNANEQVQFSQPSASSITLNRIDGREGASDISGTLTANGQIWLINPAGIVFGAGAKIDVAGLVATTANIPNEKFMAGQYEFLQSLDTEGSIINQGTIQTKSGGYVALVASNSVINSGTINVGDAGMVTLVAPWVENTGTIQANFGKVVLNSTQEPLVDFYGDHLISFDANGSASVPSKVGVKNSGAIIADGGKILLTANIAKSVMDNVINDDGYIQANRVEQRNGEIILMGGDEGVVQVSGKIKALGSSVKVLGNKVALIDKANVDVSYQNGGGEILVGGDYQGKNPGISNAERTYIGKDVVLKADALSEGNGGKIIVWANNDTRFYGTISARGGLLGGNGGFVEVSGKNTLNFDGNVDTSATIGKLGTLLLDPKNLIIATSGGSSYSEKSNNLFINNASSTTTISPGSLASVNANITLQANNDITFTNALAMTSSNKILTVQAGRNIFVNANVSTNNGAISMTANDSNAIAANRDAGIGNITVGDNVVINAGTADISMNAGAGTFTMNKKTELLTGNATGSVGTITITANNIVLNTAGANVAQIGGTAADTGFANKVVLQSGGATIGIAGGTGTFELSEKEINTIRSKNVNIGSSTAGNININAWTPGSNVASGGVLTLETGGTITQGGAINLSKNDAKLLLRSGGDITLANGGNNFSVVEIGNAHNVNLVDGNAITLGTSMINGTLSLRSGGMIALGGNITANSIGGNAIILAGTSFNNAGGYALNTGTGRFLVWSQNPANDNRGGLGYDFKQYNSTYGVTTVLGTGNGFLYTLAPTITVSLVDTVSKVYDGTTAATLTSNNYAVLGAIDGDSITLNNPTVGNFDTKNVGNNKTVSVSGLAIINASNKNSAVYQYQLSSSTSEANIGEITPAKLTYKADNSGMVYGDNVAKLSGSVSGFVGGDTQANATTGTLNFKTEATSSSHVGNYGVQGEGLVATNNNYTFSQATGNDTALTISQRAVNLTGSRTYDGTKIIKAEQLNVGNIVNNDTVTMSGEATVAAKDVNTYNSFSSNDLALSNSDYKLVDGSVNVSITPAKLTYKADNSGMVYGDNVAKLSGSVSGFVGGDTQANATTGTLNFKTEATSSSHVGNYGVQGEGLVATNNNYTFSQAIENDTALTISQRAVNLTGSRTYDGTKIIKAEQLNVGNIVNNDTVTMSGEATVAAKDVNTYTSLSSNDLALSNSNYKVIDGAVNVSITPAPLIIKPDSGQTKVYSAIDPSGFTYSAFGLLGTDTIHGLLNRMPGENVGKYSFTQGTLNAGNNYTISLTQEVFTVTPLVGAMGDQAPMGMIINQAPLGIIKQESLVMLKQEPIVTNFMDMTSIKISSKTEGEKASLGAESRENSGSPQTNEKSLPE